MHLSAPSYEEKNSSYWKKCHSTGLPHNEIDERHSQTPESRLTIDDVTQTIYLTLTKIEATGTSKIEVCKSYKITNFYEGGNPGHMVEINWNSADIQWFLRWEEQIDKHYAHMIPSRNTAQGIPNPINNSIQ